MNKYTSKIDVVTPSVASMALGIMATSLLALIVLFSGLNDSQALSIILGKDASISLLESTQNGAVANIDYIFSNDLLGRAVVFSTWAFIGLCVFIIFNVLTSSVVEAVHIEEEMSYVHQKKSNYVIELLKAVSMKLIVAMIWSILVFVTLQYVIPFAVSSGVVVFSGDSGWLDWLTFFLGVVISLVAVHVHVVFARLLAGRVRLWGT